MFGWAIWGMISAAIIVISVLGLLLASSRDLGRYIKISNM